MCKALQFLEICKYTEIVLCKFLFKCRVVLPMMRADEKYADFLMRCSLSVAAS